MKIWRWENVEQCFSDWASSGKTREELTVIRNAIEAIAKGGEEWPGVQSGPSTAHRSISIDGTKIRFTICRPLVTDLLYMNSITDD